MELNRLIEFAVLARSRNFGRAAEELQVSQPVLSTRIAMLEKTLRVKLLDRNSHQVALTEEGIRFLKDVQEIVNLDQSMRLRLNAITSGPYRSLRIIISGFSVVPLLGPFLDVFNARYPDIHLELLDDLDYGIEDGLTKGKIDLYVTYDPSAKNIPNLNHKPLLTTGLCVILPKEHKLAYKNQLSLKELDGECIIPWPETKDQYMQNYQLALLEQSSIHYSLYPDKTSPFYFFLLVPIGKGLVLCPWIMRHMTPPNSVCIPLEDKGCQVSMYIYYWQENMNPIIDEFFPAFEEWVKNEEHSV